MVNHPNRNARNIDDKYATVLAQAVGRRYYADGWGAEEALYRCWVEDAPYADMLRAVERHRRTAGPGCLRHGDEAVSSIRLIGSR